MDASDTDRESTEPDDEPGMTDYTAAHETNEVKLQIDEVITERAG